MAHAYRFYSEALPECPERVALSTDEAHHALKVVRVREGDRVALFDGTGREATGQVVLSGRRDVAVDLDGFRMEAVWSPYLTLAVAWLHKEKAVEYLIRHGTEVGVSHFVFFRGEHSERAPKESAKWKRWAIETCKQCRRMDLPEFTVVKDIEAACAVSVGQVVLADMENAPASLSTVTSGPMTIFIGPEGDFSERERQCLIDTGGVSLSLGSTTFRSEVAGVLLATLCRAQQGYLGKL